MGYFGVKGARERCWRLGCERRCGPGAKGLVEVGERERERVELEDCRGSVCLTGQASYCSEICLADMSKRQTCMQHMKTLARQYRRKTTSSTESTQLTSISVVLSEGLSGNDNDSESRKRFYAAEAYEKSALRGKELVGIEIRLRLDQSRKDQ